MPREHSPSRRTARHRIGETTSAGTLPGRGTITPAGRATGAGQGSGRAPHRPQRARYRRFRRRENTPPPRTLMTHRTMKLKPFTTTQAIHYQQYGGRRPVTARGRQGPAPHHHDDSRRPAVDGGEGTGCVCPRRLRSVNPASGAIGRLVDTAEGAVMMSNTPRVFVGTTTFLIAGIQSPTDLQT